MSNMRTVLFMGLPGSGKGVQAGLLAERLDWQVFSTGNHFKDLIAKGSPLGERVAADYNSGQLVPDWLVAYFFEETALGLGSEEGVIIDGFARSLPQAELANDVFTWLGRPYKVVYLAVNEDEALRRQLSRATTESRPDSDSEEKARARFKTYYENTAPVLQFLRDKGVLLEIDGNPPPEKIAEDIRAVLNIK